MPHDSPHWNWGAGFCKLHPGAGVPCRPCIDGGHPDLFDPDDKGQVIEHFTTLPERITVESRPRSEPIRLTCIKPTQPPAQILRDVSEGIEPTFLNEYHQQRRAPLERRFFCPHCRRERPAAKSPSTENMLCQICLGVVTENKGDFTSARRLGAELEEANARSCRTVQFKSGKGGVVEVPIDPDNSHARTMVQIAQERSYTAEQFIANQRELRVEAKNRNFGRLYEARDELETFQQMHAEQRAVEIPVRDIFFREPPRLSSSETEFYASVRERGILEPIRIRQIYASNFEVLDGARRLNAAKVLGLKTVPCIVLGESISLVKKLGLKKFGLVELADLLK